MNVGIADQIGPILFDAGKRIIGACGRRHTLSRVNGNDRRNLPPAQQVPLQGAAFYYARGHSGGVEVVSYVFGTVAAVRPRVGRVLEGIAAQIALVRAARNALRQRVVGQHSKVLRKAVLHRQQQTVKQAAGAVIHVADLGEIGAGHRICERGRPALIGVIVGAGIGRARGSGWAGGDGERSAASRPRPCAGNVGRRILFVARWNVYYVVSQITDRHLPTCTQLLFDRQIPGLRIARLHVHREHVISASRREQSAGVAGRKGLRKGIPSGITRIGIREIAGGRKDCDRIAKRRVVFKTVFHVNDRLRKTDRVRCSDTLLALAARIPGNADARLKVIPVVVDVAFGDSWIAGKEQPRRRRLVDTRRGSGEECRHREAITAPCCFHLGQVRLPTHTRIDSQFRRHLVTVLPIEGKDVLGPGAPRVVALVKTVKVSQHEVRQRVTGE